MSLCVGAHFLLRPSDGLRQFICSDMSVRHVVVCRAGLSDKLFMLFVVYIIIAIH